MYPVDRTDMSEARAAMMAAAPSLVSAARRRTVIFRALGGDDRAALMWLLAGCVRARTGRLPLFLRTQALRDRERRTQRRQRAAPHVRTSDSRRHRGRHRREPVGVGRAHRRRRHRAAQPWTRSTSPASSRARGASSERRRASAQRRRHRTVRALISRLRTGGGSSPLLPFRRPGRPGLPTYGAVAQSGSAPRSHRGGQGFKSPQLHHDTLPRNADPFRATSLRLHGECLCKHIGFCGFAESGSTVGTAPSTAVYLKTT